LLFRGEKHTPKIIIGKKEKNSELGPDGYCVMPSASNYMEGFNKSKERKL
jgi:hypothetical protein